MSSAPTEEAAGEIPGETLSVLELNTRIKGAVKAAFPDELWVRGEIKGLSTRRRGKHLYFELVEKSGGSADVNATLNVTLFERARLAVERRLAEQPGVELADGVEVRVRGRVEFYPPFGKLQLIISDIDPAFTLGKIAAERERVVRVLREEGLLDRNARLAVPVLPLRVGIVTSVDSAAHRDVLHEFEESGIGFHITVVDARVQGAQTTPTVLAALRYLARTDVDVVLLTRGGGSRTDLAWFDGEEIARAIASMPVPVFAGIGHEIDRSVADLVAARSYKTPTATAAAVVAQAREFADAVEDRWRRTVDAAALHCAAAEAGRADAARRIVTATRRGVDEAARNLRHAGSTTRLLALGRLDRAEAHVDHITRFVAVSDPARLLARGWTITHAADGALVRSVTEVAAGTRLRTTLADGVVVSVVEATEASAPTTEHSPDHADHGGDR